MYEVTIPGPEGRIEGRYNKGSIHNPPVVILLHPHPAHGGNMNNKVIYNCFKTISNLCLSAIPRILKIMVTLYPSSSAFALTSTLLIATLFS